MPEFLCHPGEHRPTVLVHPPSTRDKHPQPVENAHQTPSTHLQRHVVGHDDFAAHRRGGVVGGRRVELGQQEAGLHARHKDMLGRLPRENGQACTEMQVGRTPVRRRSTVHAKASLLCSTSEWCHAQAPTAARSTRRSTAHLAAVLVAVGEARRGEAALDDGVRFVLNRGARGAGRGGRGGSGWMLCCGAAPRTTPAQPCPPRRAAAAGSPRWRSATPAAAAPHLRRLQQLLEGRVLWLILVARLAPLQEGRGRGPRAAAGSEAGGRQGCAACAACAACGTREQQAASSSPCPRTHPSFLVLSCPVPSRPRPFERAPSAPPPRIAAPRRSPSHPCRGPPAHPPTCATVPPWNTTT